MQDGINFDSFSIELQVAVVAVRKAAVEIQQRNIAGSERNNDGGINDYVTIWDTVGQEMITSEIRSKFPNDTIIGEESPSYSEESVRAERLWVIDPIDGTANARAQRKYSFISLGFIQNGQSAAGVVYDPYHDELFYGESGRGSFMNGQKICVGNVVDGKQSSINTDMGFINEVSDLHQDILKVYGSPSRRMMGSSIGEMIEVACGKADLFFYTCIKPWDNAAVFCILEEAGALIRGVDGRKINFTSMDLVTGNPTLVADFVERVGKIFERKIGTVQRKFLKKNPKLIPIVSGLHTRKK